MDNKHNATHTTPVQERELVMERVFDAPRELVFDAYTQAEHLKQWWMPPGWTIEIYDLDFRPGGVWHYCMRGPDGEESWGRAAYQEIDRPNRFVYVDSFSDAAGNVVADMPQCVVTMDFHEQAGNKTKVTSRALYGTREELESVKSMGVEEGMSLFFDNLANYLAGLQAAAR